MKLSAVNGKITLLGAVIAVPFLVAIVINGVYTVNMPNWDDYDSVLNWLHEYLTAGGLQEKLSLLFIQHNEHRIVINRLFVLAQYMASGHVNFLFLNFIGLSAVLIIALYFVTAGIKITGSRLAVIPIPYILLSFSTFGLVSFAMASITQYWQILFSIIAIAAASRAESKFVFIALASAFLAAFSGAGGLLVFPAVLIQQLARKEKFRAVLWLLAMAAVGWFYFIFLRYQTPANGVVTEHVFLRNPFELVWYALAFLGNFGAAFPDGLMVSGFFGLILCVFLLASLRSRSGIGDDVPYTIAFLMILTAGSAALSRFSGGLDSALSSRYTIYSSVFACAVYIIYVRRAPTSRMVARRILMISFLSLIIYVSWIPIAIHYLANQRLRLRTAIVYPQELRAKKILAEAKVERTFTPAFALPIYLPVDESSHVPLVLSGKETMGLQLRLGRRLLPHPQRLTGIGLFIGNYGGTSDGRLLIRACGRSSCGEGSISLLGGADNSYASVTFGGHGFEVAAGDLVNVWVRYEDGSVPIAIWMYSSLPTSVVTLQSVGAAASEGRIPKLSLDLK